MVEEEEVVVEVEVVDVVEVVVVVVVEVVGSPGLLVNKNN